MNSMNEKVKFNIFSVRPGSTTFDHISFSPIQFIYVIYVYTKKHMALKIFMAFWVKERLSKNGNKSKRRELPYQDHSQRLKIFP